MTDPAEAGRKDAEEDRAIGASYELPDPSLPEEYRTAYANAWRNADLADQQRFDDQRQTEPDTGHFGEVPITVFEGKRVDVNFFRYDPPKTPPTIRQQYRLHLGFNTIGQRWYALEAKLGILVDTDTGLHKLIWKGARDERLDTLSWETREHLLGALRGLQYDLSDLDREDATNLVGRHEGHHHHVSGLSMLCSCNDNVMLTYWSGVPSSDSESLICDVCGKLGMVSYRHAFGHERGEKP